MMAKPSVQRIDALDVTKFICAWMVVVIHTTPLKKYSQIADILTAQGICRIAVPCFFAISAFLLFYRMSEDKKENIARIKRYCVRILYMYISWSAVYTFLYIAINLDNIAWGIPFFVERFRLWVFEASHYHLWYLLSTIYAVPIVYILYSIGGVGVLRTIAPPLWMLRCLQLTYNWLGLFTPMFDWLQRNCDAATNVFFVRFR